MEWETVDVFLLFASSSSSSFKQNPVPLRICTFLQKINVCLLGGLYFLHFQQLYQVATGLMPKYQRKELKKRKEKKKNHHHQLSKKYFLYNLIVPNSFTNYFHTHEYKHIMTVYYNVGHQKLVTPQLAFSVLCMLIYQSNVIGISSHLAQIMLSCVFYQQVSA